MSPDAVFTPRSLTAAEYVLELFEPSDNAAILVRNRSTGQTVRRIAKAKTVSSPDFQTWLANQNVGGSDVFIGMNPIKDGAYSRTGIRPTAEQSENARLTSPSRQQTPASGSRRERV